LGKRTLIYGASVVLLLAMTAPLAVPLADPFENTQLPSILLELRGLEAALTSDLLQLRLGFLANYDSLSARDLSIVDKTNEFVAGVQALREPARSRILAAFAEFQERLEKRRPTLEGFPTENATLNQSLRLLDATADRARNWLAERSEPDLAAELDGVQTRTLQYYTRPEPAFRTALLADIQDLTVRTDAMGGVVRAMLGHARVVAEQTGPVQAHVQGLIEASGEEALLDTFQVLEQESHTSLRRTKALRTGLSVICILAVVITCAAGIRTVLRQNADLAREMRERERANQEARQLETELRQSQKLESVGQLAAGIAHEINTPTQYVTDNMHFLRDAFQEVLGAVEGYKLELESRARVEDGPGQALAGASVKIDLEFFRTEIPRALGESLEGLSRVSTIVKAMKSFSHPSSEMTPGNLNAAIESTTTVARSEWKYVADLELDLAPDLPAVPCLLSEFNQVVLNMLVNAAHAIAARPAAPGESSAPKGKIRISTRLAGNQAEIRISDTGTGIPPHVLPRIFDPFFTTKEVGKGTGQGLAIAHNVIVRKHSRSIDVETTPGVGTTFVVRLPLKREAPLEAVAA
jgi:signal transduction histidine kinase